MNDEIYIAGLYTQQYENPHIRERERRMGISCSAISSAACVWKLSWWRMMNVGKEPYKFFITSPPHSHMPLIWLRSLFRIHFASSYHLFFFFGHIIDVYESRQKSLQSLSLVADLHTYRGGWKFIKNSIQSLQFQQQHVACNEVECGRKIKNLWRKKAFHTHSLFRGTSEKKISSLRFYQDIFVCSSESEPY